MQHAADLLRKVCQTAGSSSRTCRMGLDGERRNIPLTPFAMHEFDKKRILIAYM